MSAQDFIDQQMELHKKGNKVGAAFVALLSGFRQATDDMTFGAITAAEESDSVAAAGIIVGRNVARVAAEAATENVAETVAKAACTRLGGSACRKVVEKVSDALTKERGSKSASLTKESDSGPVSHSFSTTASSNNTRGGGDGSVGAMRVKGSVVETETKADKLATLSDKFNRKGDINRRINEGQGYNVAKETKGLETRGVKPAAGTRIRPEGVPEEWRIRQTRGKGGTEYFNPDKPNESVRIMQGNPNSPYPNSQKPYVRHMDSSGSHLDSIGNRGGSRRSETHIPLDQFKFRK